MSEIRSGYIFDLPKAPNFDAWQRAWSEACTGLRCEGIQTGFVNSLRILLPSLFASVIAGAVTGYALSFWRIKGANILFGGLLLGAFIPFQVFIYPLVRMFAAAGIFNTIWAIVLIHTIFGLPVMTLLFRNFYAGIPIDLFKAARVDGGSFWQIFFRLILPMSTPMIVVTVILQVTIIWNDYLGGLVFAGLDNLPMTVQLINLVNAFQGEREYNVNMAATILTALVPLIVYLVSGRWFVRGIAAGAVKG
jgi:glucose/mannose transport system permease protein